MPDQLEEQLAALYRPVAASDGGLASVKRRGARRRYRRRATAAILASVTVTAGGVGLVELIPSQHAVQVNVGSSTSPKTGAPLGAPRKGSGEPAQFVDISVQGLITVVDTTTGRTIRTLTRASGSSDGTLSADAKTFYLDAAGRTPSQPTCPTGTCAINVSTGATRPLPPFSWRIQPQLQSISPDGRKEATVTESGLSTVVRIAQTSGTPRVYRLPPTRVTLAQPLWSSNSAFIAVDFNGPAPTILNITTGHLTTVETPARCRLFPMAMSNTVVYSEEQCNQTIRLARNIFSTGRSLPNIPVPADFTGFASIGVDPSGRYVIASVTQSGRQRVLYTEQTGHWEKIPQARGSWPAW